MITLTSRAAAKVSEMRASLTAPTKNLRVSVETGGCSGMEYAMSFDDPKPNDETFSSEGQLILVDPASMGYLRGSSIDFDDGLTGKGFEIRNPNAKSTCGCGKSFA